MSAVRGRSGAAGRTIMPPPMADMTRSRRADSTARSPPSFPMGVVVPRGCGRWHGGRFDGEPSNESERTMKRRIRDFQHGAAQSAERPGDAAPSPGDTFMPRRRRGGFSLVELIVTLGLIAVALGIAVPRAPRGAFAMWRGHAQLMGDLRQ